MTPSSTVGIVTEYYEKGSLADVLDDKTEELPWARRSNIMIGSAKGLVFLHQSSMLHRDWVLLLCCMSMNVVQKSSNILIDKNYCAKICDFG